MYSSHSFLDKIFFREMILQYLIALSVSSSVVYGDICGMLVDLLTLADGGESYVTEGLCFGLFWKGLPMHSVICANFDGVAPNCPSENPVRTSEAFEILHMSLGAGLAERGPSSERSAAAHSVLDEAVFDIIAFGDWGNPRHPEYLTPIASLISRWFNSTGAVFLLGDNFYPRGIDVSFGVYDPAFRLFSRILARSTCANFYVLFGNHDYLGSPDAQIQYTDVHAQWKFPSPYYFKSFRTSIGRICCWFLDTNVDQFDAIQARWLNHTLRDESHNCVYRIVSGHHPIFDGGEYKSNQHLINHLLPILTRYKVHLYLSGHEHQSQILRSPEHPTVFLVAGAVADIRPPVSRGHEYLRYINMKNEAILRLVFFENRIEFFFVPTDLEKRRKSQPPKPLAFGTVPRIITSV